MNKATQSKSVKKAASASTKEQVISLYEAAIKIHPRNVKGVFTSWRWIMVWATQLFFYGMPWIHWGQRQALLFDLEAKRFYIYGLVLYPQDLIYLTTLLIVSALSLFLFTAVAGRLWCGYTCPQTVYTEIFLWIESKIEGDRAARIKLDQAPFFRRLPKKATKHTVWVIFALWTGFTFVGYFTPIRELTSSLMQNALSGWETFWILFYGFATYGNAGFLREQVCKYMCPYARFQSVMFDNDTMVVAYDEARGEPRGSRSKKDSQTSLQGKNLGACIDCTLCVQVCPTGIDIRNGLQYMCIGCGACVDACDSIMDKMNYPRGLIKYATQNGVSHHWSKKEMLAHIIRPRVLIYSGILLLLVIGMLVSLVNRDSFRIDTIRDRGVMARLEGSMIENVYRLQIMNASEKTQRYQISATGLEGLMVHIRTKPDGDEKIIFVDPAEVRGVALDLAVPDGSVKPGSHKVTFVVKSLDTNEIVSDKSVFLVPR